MTSFFGISGFEQLEAAYRPAVHGHRGARATLPENSLAGLGYAIDVGADVVEFDTVLTRDDVIVLNHDTRINTRLCLLNGKALQAKDNLLIRTLSLSQLQKYDCGSIPNPKFPKQNALGNFPLPTLNDALKRISEKQKQTQRKVFLNIETKTGDGSDLLTDKEVEIFVNELLKILRTNKMEENTILQSFDPRSLIVARTQKTQAKLSYLNANPKIDSAHEANKIGASIVSPHLEMVDDNFMKAARKHGLQVVPWTANTEEEWQKLVNLQVDGIITDDPEALIGFLKKKELR